MKTIMITGASRGIGRAIALRLIDEPYRFIIHYRERRKDAETVVATLRDAGRDAMAYGADLRDSAAVNAMFDAVESRFGSVDILVNNAGVADLAFFDAIDETTWLDIFNVNVHGAYRTTVRAVPSMIRKKDGVIVNIASIWGMVGAAMEVHYSATKGALIAMTKALAKELGPSGISVNAVAPGAVATEMLAVLSDETLDRVAEATPLGRIGRPEDVAEAVAYLLSDAGRYNTGQVLSPNGGFTIC